MPFPLNPRLPKLIPMKHNAPGLLALVFGLIGLGAWAEIPQPLPAPFPETRYQQMSAKSPFAVATASSASTAAPTPGFAVQLYVDGIAHVSKTDWVAIKNRDPQDPGKPTVMFVEVGGTTTDGMKVNAVHWSEMGKSTVDVTSKDGEKATLTFDEMAIKNPGGAPSMVPGQPGVRMPPLPGQGRPVGFPASGPFQQPGGQINRNRVFLPQANSVMPGQPNGAPGVDQHVRRRVIPSGQ